ncbi:MAG: 2-C-methyl-D-erythritol 4-phosphate cytidylyltransferase, partial [Longimicrobiales bacterium]|nr:2-C-methyl-D-erythritol 4-phosphate cytidylyltransferase [Longimicrobiales bacterium]
MSNAGPDAPATVGVAIPAAGFGRRMGGVRKPLLQLAGEPILRHALRPFLADPRVISIVVAMAPD